MTVSRGPDGGTSRAGYADRTDATVRYKRESDGWYVRTRVDTDWWRFARPEARDRDVRVLIGKKWCLRWGDPDRWTDRE